MNEKNLGLEKLWDLYFVSAVLKFTQRTFQKEMFGSKMAQPGLVHYLFVEEENLVSK